jgi:hypothetical protein
MTCWSLASATSSILALHWDSLRISCSCPVTWRSCFLGSIEWVPSCTPGFHQWGRCLHPGSGPERHLCWWACKLSHSHTLEDGSPANTPTPGARARSPLLPRGATGPTLPSVCSWWVTWPVFPLSWPQGQLPPAIDGKGQGRGWGHLILATTQQTRGRASLPHSCPQAGSLTTLTSEASSAVLSRRGTAPALLTAAAGDGQDQFFCFNDPIGVPSPCLLPVVGPALPHLYPGANSLTTPVCGAFSQILQLASGWVSSSASRASSPTMRRWGQSQFCTALRQQHVWDSSPDQDIYLVFGGNRPLLLQDHGPWCGLWWQHRSGLHHGPGGTIVYSHQTVPHYPWLSSSASFHCAHILLLLFLCHFSLTYSLLLVVPRVSECLESSQVCYARLVHYGAGRGPTW